MIAPLGAPMPFATRVIIAVEQPEGHPMYLYGWARGDTTMTRDHEELDLYALSAWRRESKSVRTSIEWEEGWPVMHWKHPGHDFPRAAIDRDRPALAP